MEPFCDVEGYRAKYAQDQTEDGVLTEFLLEATDLICAALDASEISYTDPTESFTFRLRRICREVVHRAIGDASSQGIDANLPFGATKFSETSDAFSADVELANPYGDLFLTQAERDALGIGRQVVCVIDPYAPPPPPDGEVP